MEEEADYHDIAPETEYYQDYQDLLRRRTGGERAADDEAKMGAVELSIQKLQANLEGPLREYSDAKLQAYLDAHFDLSIWLVLRKRQWVSHRYGLFRRRLEKKEKEQREELRRKAMEWNAGLRAACVPWTPNEVFRSRDFASRVHDRARELEEFDEEEKADLTRIQDTLLALRRKTVSFVTLPSVGGVSGADFSKPQMENMWEIIVLDTSSAGKKKTCARSSSRRTSSFQMC